MSGISGYLSNIKKISTNEFFLAQKLISHRGPDEVNFSVIKKNKFLNIFCDDLSEINSKRIIFEEKNENFIIGHNSSSNLDDSNKCRQPYIFKNLCLSFNGRIYNFVELRNKLEKAGYKFESNCEAEIFIKAFDNWGINAFNYFNGMWAAAIYDKSSKKLVICRDRYGIKPLYYSYLNDQFVFASEIRFIRKILKLNDPNPELIKQYIDSSVTDYNSETFLKNIFQIEPGNYLELKFNKIQIKRYYDLNFENSKVNIDLKELLLKSIKFRLNSKFEVGALISGGIDSNVILGVIDKNKLVKKFKTFSAVFKNNKYSEFDLIQEINKKNIIHEKILDYQDCSNYKSDIEKLIKVQEEPFRSLSVLSSYKIYKRIAKDKKIKVILSGQGADALFAGSENLFYIFLIELLLKFKFSKFIKEFFYFRKKRNFTIIKIIKKILINIFSLYFKRCNKFGIFHSNFIKLRNLKLKRTLLKQKLFYSFTNSALREYLRYEDKNSMNFSIETREPFLDFNIVDKVSKVPSECLIKNGVLKYYLREQTKEFLPNKIYKNNNKYAFDSPQEIWQKTILKEEFDITFRKIQIEGIFSFIDNAKVYKIYSKYSQNKFNDWTLIWRLYCLYKWKEVMEINNI